MISRSTKSRTRATMSRCSCVSVVAMWALARRGCGLWLRRRAEPRPLSAQEELRRHLARRLVDHLVAEHHRAAALHLGGVPVGVEDSDRSVELLLARRERLVARGDLVGVQAPLAVVAKRRGLLRGHLVAVDVADRQVGTVD